MSGAEPAPLTFRARLLRWLWDFTRSTIYTLIIVGIGTGLLSALSTSFAFILMMAGLLVPLVFVAAFAGPGAIVLSGLIRGRTGFMFGPIAVFLLAPLAWKLMFAANIHRLEALQQEEFLKPEGKIDTVVLERSIKCGDLCTRIVAETDLGLVVGARSGPHNVYRVFRVTGPSCNTAEDAFFTFTYIQAGYPDTCQREAFADDNPDGLVLRMRSTHSIDLPPDFSEESFEGKFYEVLERHGGKERLLGRLIDGKVGGGPVPAALLFPAARLGMSFRPQKFGGGFTEEDFLANALALLGLSFEEHEPSAATVDALVDRTLTILEAKPRFDGSGVMLRLGNRYQKAFPDPFRHAVDRLLASDDPKLANLGAQLALTDPDPAMAAAVMDRLIKGGKTAAWQTVFANAQIAGTPKPGEMLPAIATALRSHDARLVLSGLRITQPLSAEARRPIAGDIEAVAFDPAVWGGPDDVISPFTASLDAVPPDVGEQGRALFRDAARVAPQRVAGFALLCRGAGRDKAFTELAALSGEDFAVMTQAVKLHGFRTLCRSDEDFWTDNERNLLIDRLQEIPVGQIESYLDALYRNAAEGLPPRLKAAMDRRIAADPGAAPELREIFKRSGWKQ